MGAVLFLAITGRFSPKVGDYKKVVKNCKLNGIYGCIRITPCSGVLWFGEEEMDKDIRGRKDVRGAYSKYFVEDIDVQGDESAPGGGGRRCPIFVAHGKAFDREEILERLFKALRELEFWADMHERVSKMMREREEKRQRQTEDRRRLDSRDMYRNHFKSIGKNGKRKL